MDKFLSKMWENMHRINRREENIKEVLNIILQDVPAHINIDNIKKTILALDGVKGVHDIHIWSLEGETDIFTRHIVVEEKLLKKMPQVQEAITG